MVTLVRVAQTCYACPSQWDAWDAHGNYYYLRFRFGHGTVTKDGIQVASFEHGDDMAGCISLDDFAELAGITIHRRQYR